MSTIKKNTEITKVETKAPVNLVLYKNTEQLIEKVRTLLRFPESKNEIIIANQSKLIEVLISYSKSEQKIIERTFEKHFGQYNEKDARELAKYLQKLTKLLDIKEIYDSEYYGSVAVYIINKFQNNTLSELKEAIELAISHKLDIEDTKHYNSLNIVWLSNIICSYNRYTADIKSRFTKVIFDIINTPAPPSKEEADENKRKDVIQRFDYFKRTNQLQIGDELCYDFLVEKKLLKPSDEEKNKAIKIAKDIIVQELELKRMRKEFTSERNEIQSQIKEVMNSLSHSPAEVRSAKKIILKNYFMECVANNINLEDIINNILVVL